MKKNQNPSATNSFLTSDVAHDLNNIMAVIKLYAQLGLRHPTVDKQLSENFNIILDQVAAAKRLIGKVTDAGGRSSAEDPLH